MKRVLLIIEYRNIKLLATKIGLERSSNQLKTMRILIIFITCLCACSGELTAQNLVPNPSFETIDSNNMSWGNSDIARALYWKNAGGSPDYFNHNDPGRVPENEYGCQWPRTGDGYGGIYCYEIPLPFFRNVREYIRIQLLDTLIAGRNYKVSYYASRADNSKHAIKVGANLSVIQINSFDTLLMIAPTHIISNSSISDTSSWTLVSGVYEAVGGEQFLTIGNFIDDSLSNLETPPASGSYSMAYYYIDDVSVELMEQEPNYIDESIVPDPLLFPNPTQKKVWIRLHKSVSQPLYCAVFASDGRVISEERLIPNQGLVSLDFETFKSGVYYLKIEYDDHVFTHVVYKIE